VRRTWSVPKLFFLGVYFFQLSLTYTLPQFSPTCRFYLLSYGRFRLCLHLTTTFPASRGQPIVASQRSASIPNSPRCLSDVEPHGSRESDPSFRCRVSPAVQNMEVRFFFSFRSVGSRSSSFPSWFPQFLPIHLQNPPKTYNFFVLFSSLHASTFPCPAVWYMFARRFVVTDSQASGLFLPRPQTTSNSASPQFRALPVRWRTFCLNSFFCDGLFFSPFPLELMLSSLSPPRCRFFIFYEDSLTKDKIHTVFAPRSTSRTSGRPLFLSFFL